MVLLFGAAPREAQRKRRSGFVTGLSHTGSEKSTGGYSPGMNKGFRAGDYAEEARPEVALHLQVFGAAKL
jgi:hypothetical protein